MFLIIIYLQSSVPQLTPCKCSRKFPEPQQPISLANTTCSEQAHARGPGQKVMAFSYYEKDSDLAVNRLESGQAEGNVDMFFFAGLEINLELLPQHYPGWVIRLYHDIEEKDPLMDTLCSYACKYPYLDLCNANNIPAPMLTGKMV